MVARKQGYRVLYSVHVKSWSVTEHKHMEMMMMMTMDVMMKMVMTTKNLDMYLQYISSDIYRFWKSPVKKKKKKKKGAQ